MLKLQVIIGNDAGKCLYFQQSVVTIGSAPGNDFVLSDAEASEYHGRFTCNHAAGQFAYCDLQSTHGTRVQSHSVDVSMFSRQMAQSIVLANDTDLTIGRTVIHCRYADDTPKAHISELMHRKLAISHHALPPTKDTELLAFLLATSTALTSRSTYQGVMSHLSKAILQRIGNANHVAIWRLDKMENSLTCAYEQSRSKILTPKILSQEDCLRALESQCTELYIGSNGLTQYTIIAPLQTAGVKIGVLLVDSTPDMPLTRDDLDCIARLTSIASYALERSFYNADLSTVFDGFIRAMIAVMDARDPATAGHSIRVSQYTLYLAQAIHADQSDAFKNITFSQQSIDELRFASLLHDIGKVVLRREILLKSSKLSPPELRHLLERIDLFSAWFSTQSPKDLGSRYRSQMQFDHYREIVTRTVQADVHPTDADLDYLRQMRETSIPTCPDIELLSADEFEALCIPYGTLSKSERKEIQRHALISWQYLSQISWPQKWANVPIFVLQHHEKLNGTGYPYGLSGNQILLQSRMIAVCDIFDALTGGDRSYKTRHSYGDAVRILREDAESGGLDTNIVEIFVSKVIPQISDTDTQAMSIINRVLDFSL